jgi:S1-C subfamily serine protease
MKIKTILSTAIALLFFVLTTFAQEEDYPHSTIHIVRKDEGKGSQCRTDITFPNQREFNLSIGSLVNYKLYSEGEILITVEINCPPGNYSRASTKSIQLSLNIKRGNEYYVLFEMNEGLHEISKLKGDAYLLITKNQIKQSENLDYPINKFSLRDIKRGERGQGTCFALTTNGYLITNYHVIENAKEVTVKGIDGDFTTKYGASVVATDKTNDLALLKIGNKNVTFDGIPYSIRSSGVQQGDKIFALGFPMAASMGDEVKLTDGIISAKSGTEGDISKFQISAAVNPGNSGGPLIDEQGNIIGVIYAKSTVAEAAGYALKAGYLQTFLDNVEGLEHVAPVNTFKDKSFPEKIAEWKKFIFIVETN